MHCHTLPQQTWDLTEPYDATMNWTFTISDKRSTTPAFDFTTATTRLDSKTRENIELKV